MARLQLATCSMALVLTVATTASSSCAKLTPAEIAALPQDKVEQARQHCARLFPDQFSTRLYCEDQELTAIKQLIDRGSIKPKGDKL